MEAFDYRKIPVLGEYDVVVAGAGVGGCAAALAAAREGARTLLMEKNACPGGVATSANVPNLMGLAKDGRWIVGGLAQKLIWRLARDGFAYVRVADRFAPPPALREDSLPATVLTSVHGLQITLLRLLREAGVTTRFYTGVLGAQTRENRITALAVDAAEGVRLVRGWAFVDATGDAHLTCRAGGTTRLATPEESMSKTLIIDVAGVAEVTQAQVEEAFYREAREGRMPVAIQNRFMGYRLPAPGEVQLNFTAVAGEALTSEGLSEMDAALREQTECTVDWFRKCIPGFAGCHLLRTPAVVGVRAGRGGVGLETITRADIDANTPVAEPVGLGLRRYGDHGVRETLSAGWADLPGVRAIPWRALLHRDIGNLALAGRAISCEPGMLTCVRYMGQCLVSGEAAGVTAALAAGAQSELPAAGYQSVRARLLAAGAILA